VRAELYLDLTFFSILFCIESSGKIMIPFIFLKKMKFVVALALLCIITVEPWRVNSEEQRLLVNMTLVANARDTGARK
jgi:hypothetical protein